MTGRTRAVRSAYDVTLSGQPENLPVATRHAVKDLCETSVSDAQWRAFLTAYAPDPAAGVTKTSRGATLAASKRGELQQLWTHDARVSRWKGTAFGVVQAVNTREHHLATVKGGDPHVEPHPGYR